MKQLLTRAALATTLALATISPAFAQAVDPARILIVDLQRVFAQSAAGQDAQRQLKTQEDQLNTRFKTLQDQFRKEEEALAKQRSVVDENAFRTRVQEFQTRANRAETDLNTRQQELRRSAAWVNQQILTGVNPILQELLQQRGANIITDRQQVLIAAPALDVTQTVIERLNTRLPKVSITPPAQPAAGAAPAAAPAATPRPPQP
jgi:Skp family chaperone for outer membrane proteins